MSKPKKLNDLELGVLKQEHEMARPLYPDGAIGRRQFEVNDMLLDHIAAMEVENQRWGNRAAKDAFEVGHANATFIERQTERIQELELGIQSILDESGLTEHPDFVSIKCPDGDSWMYTVGAPTDNYLVLAIIELLPLVKKG